MDMRKYISYVILFNIFLEGSKICFSEKYFVNFGGIKFNLFLFFWGGAERPPEEKGVDKATKHIYAKSGKNKAANRSYVKTGGIKSQKRAVCQKKTWRRPRNSCM